MSWPRSGVSASAAVLWLGLFLAIVPFDGPAFAQDPGLKAPTVAEPESYRTDEYRKPVPATLKGAKVLTGEEASALWTAGSSVFIDVYPYAPKPDNLPANTVWREPKHFTIENAKWLANVGYGVLSAETEAYFKKHLEHLSGGDKAKPLVFFCLRNCWMSWNSAKRAMTYGYTNVYWFSEGTDAWQEIGQHVTEAKPEP
jgi:PQQ-dependent catabolism-associated CXXCW motif protein